MDTVLCMIPFNHGHSLIKPDFNLVFIFIIKLFFQRPLKTLSSLLKNDQKARNFRLVLWYFEDQLKIRYQDFVVAIEVKFLLRITVLQVLYKFLLLRCILVRIHAVVSAIE